MYIHIRATELELSLTRCDVGWYQAYVKSPFHTYLMALYQ